MIEANRRVSVLVGVLVVVVGVVLAAILIFLGSATRLFGKSVHVSACFSDVTGLRAGASVLQAGVAVGAVSHVALGDGCVEGARVDLSLDAAAAGRLAADTRARLVTMGLLGDRLVALVPGHARARLMRGQLIQGEVPPDASEVIAQAGQAFDVLVHLARRLDETLSQAKLEGAMADVTAAIGSLRRVVDRLERGPGALHLLLFDPTLQRELRALGPAAERVAKAAQHAEQASAHVEDAARDASQIVGYVKSGQGTLGGVIYDPAIYEDLRTIVGRARRSVILRTLGRFVLKHH